MALFIQDDTTISNPRIYSNILIDNRIKSIRIVIKDIEVNHKLIVERLYINDNDCYVNTSRGNFILNTEDPKLHLVFYNKRWLSVGRDNAVPLIDVSVDRISITNNQYQNCKFGEHFIQTKTYNTNTGVDTRYYISDRLLVAAPDYHLGSLGCIFVYSKDTNNQYTILEDMITIPYNYTQTTFQGKFGSKFDLIDMNGYHYLVVCAPNRKKIGSECSVYIYSYKKRTDQTFYFHHETLNREIVVPRINTLKNLVITNNKAIHLIFDKEIITYYISSHESNTIQISTPYFMNTSSSIKDVRSTDTYVYVLFETSIVKYSFPQGDEGSLIELTTHIGDLSGVQSFLIDVSEGIVATTNNKIYFYNDQEVNTNTFTFLDPTTTIKDIDLFNRNPNELVLLLSNGKVYQVNNKTTSSLKGTLSSINTQTKIRYHVSNSMNAIVGFPEVSDGIIKSVQLTDLSSVDISNYKNTLVQPEISVSEDAENVYIYDRRTKIVSVLLRNPKNVFILSHTILPKEDLINHLRFRDTILDVKINYNLGQLLFSVYPYNDNKSSVIISDLNSYSYLGKWLGTTSGFGKSIDIRDNTAIISDPDVADAIISNISYEKGSIDVYNLKPASNYAKINTTPLRSTLQIGKISRLSPNLNEIISIGLDGSISLFSNIYDLEYRRLTLSEKASDAQYFLEGRVVQTNKTSPDKFYRYQKVNGCFEIITKREVNIPELTNVNSNITILPLGKNYTFFYYSGNILLFDIRDMKLVKSWPDTYTTNVSVGIDGSTISYANQTATGIEYIVCS
jgi:hypothetical protein